MTTREVKTALSHAARRCWPDKARASDLPFPDYWKGVTEVLTFHAPHVGDALMWQFIDEFAVTAKEAEERGETPTPPAVPDEIRRLWSRAKTKDEAWAHAAERASEVKARFSARRTRQGVML